LIAVRTIVTTSPGLSWGAARAASLWCIAGYILPLVTFLLMVPGALAILGERAAPADKRAAGITALVLLVVLVWFLTRSWHRYYWNLRKARRWGLGLWRVRPFAGRLLSSPSAMKAAAGQLDTDNLLGAYHCPDHTDAAKAVIAEDLRSRGVADSVIAHWSPPPAALTVPLPALQRQVDAGDAGGFFNAWFGLTRVVVSIGVLAAVIAIVAMVMSGLPIGTGPGPRPFDNRAALGWIGQALTVTGACIVAYFLVLLPIGILAASRKKMRILLLRPFGQRAMTRALKGVVLRYLGSRGHVFTLSDANYRPNPFLRIADFAVNGGRYVVAPIFRPSVRIATVFREKDYLGLAARLSRHIGLGVRNFMTGGQAYNIKTTDRWWQRCIHMLMHSTHVVVMDISRVSRGSTWEIEQLTRRGILDRTVFIVQQRHQDGALDGIAAMLPAGARPTVHVFDESGRFVDPAAFMADLARPLETRQAPTLAAASR
jgi:hypothetical protein